MGIRQCYHMETDRIIFSYETEPCDTFISNIPVWEVKLFTFFSPSSLTFNVSQQFAEQ